MYFFFLNFLSLFFLFVTFLCFSCNNFQHIFPPIYDNNPFYFSVRFFIRILSAFNHCASSALFYGEISRLLFVLLPLYDLWFSSNVNISSLALIFPTLRILFVLPNVLNHKGSFFPQIFSIEL